MTKAKAIDLLDNLIGMVTDNHDSDYDEALKMAIDTLQRTSNAHPTHECVKPTHECVEKQVKGDLISRQAVLDFVGSMEMTDQISADAYKELTIYLEGLLSEPVGNSEQLEWIPCSERLPELHRSKYVPHPYLEQSSLFEDYYYMMSEPVLVTRINPFIEPEERIVVAQYEDDLDGRTYWQTTDAEQLVDVVAWMPLPDPYNKGGNK